MDLAKNTGINSCQWWGSVRLIYYESHQIYSFLLIGANLYSHLSFDALHF